ncbi:glycosyltransferase [Nocardioides dokdonensis]|nr:glycosyltransferase [Nocardioides dokdonensis]
MPSGHVYVRHLAPEGPGPARGALRLPDPPPRAVDPEPGQWWPPAMLDPAWVREHDFDVLHLHFGFDALDPDDLVALVDAVHDTGRAFVQTVHDLRNPHHLDRRLHDEQLDALLPRADALLTLTPGAAGEIQRRWGREATVVPHPHVVDLRTMAVAADCRARRRTDAFRVGLHVKSLRPSMAPLRVLPTLAETVADLPGAVLQVNAHRDVVQGGAREDAELYEWLRDAEASGSVDLRVHDFLPDQDLWNYLGSLDLSVLPYRFGTHSGWLEACRDLGTTVLAPTCGYFAEQGPVLSYEHDEDHIDLASLDAAVRRAHAERPQWGAGIDERRVQRAEVAAVHERVYADVARTVGR